MKTEQWTKEESILVLNLYQSKPKGMKPTTNADMVHLAQMLGRTPEALYRRMLKFRQWYPVLPFTSDIPIYIEEDPSVWSDYFYDSKKTRTEAADILLEISRATLILNLYFGLIINTMDEKVPEVVDMAKKVKSTAAEVVNMLHAYASLDPFNKKNVNTDIHVPNVCHFLWERYADDMDGLSRVAKYIETHYPKRRPGRKKSTSK